MSDLPNLSHLKADERAILTFHLKRREAQTCPSPRPYIWFLLAGRGAGKTWTAANHIFEYARELALTLPESQENDIIRVGLIGQNFSDVRGTMVEGQSGLLAVIPKELQIKYNRTNCELWVSIPSAKRTLYFQGFTSQVPDKLRGPNFHIAWLDEPAKFEDADEEPMGNNTTWSNLLMCTRLGWQVNAPHIIVSGTPTSCKLVQYLYDHEDSVVTHMTTMENYDNLPKAFQNEINNMNKNSRTYQQEIEAKILLANQNAVFSEDTIDHGRGLPPAPEDCPNGFFKVLGWDPSVGTSDEGDEAGIVLVGYTPEVKEKRGARGGKPIILEPAHAYVLEDLSGHISPYDQAALVVKTILKHRATDLVFETNQGADVLITMVEQVIKELSDGKYTIRREKKRRREDYGSIARFNIQIQVPADEETGEESFTHKFTASAVHVSQNKRTRAETAAMKYDQKQVHHPPVNTLPKCEKDMCKASLEGQMISWNPANTNHRRSSPDRLDALVYALFLIFGVGGKRVGANTVFASPTGGGNYEKTSSQITQQDKKRGRASIYSQDIANGRQTGSDPMRGSGWAVPVYNDPVDRITRGF